MTVHTTILSVSFSLIVGALALTIGYDARFVCLVAFHLLAALLLLWLLVRPADLLPNTQTA